MFFSVLTLGHPREFWKFLFSNLVFTTPEVYLKGCIHCLVVTNDTYYDNHIVWYEWAEKETKKIGSFKTRKHKLFLWSSFVFRLYTIWQKIKWSVRDFLGCILCSLFSWPGLLVTLPLTHSLTSRHLDIWDIWVMHCCYERKKLESKIHVKVIWTG